MNSGVQPASSQKKQKKRVLIFAWFFITTATVAATSLWWWWHVQRRIPVAHVVAQGTVTPIDQDKSQSGENTQQLSDQSWHPLDNKDIILNKNSVKTAPDSFATLHLSDGSQVTLSPNTHIKVHQKATQPPHIALFEGKISIDHTPQGIDVINQKAEVMHAQPDSQTVISTEQGSLEMIKQQSLMALADSTSPTANEATLPQPDASQPATDGISTQLPVEAQPDITQVPTDDIPTQLPVEPQPDATQPPTATPEHIESTTPPTATDTLMTPLDNQVMTASQESLNVDFLWGKNNTKEPSTLEIATDPQFENIIVTKYDTNASHQQELAPGVYYWHVKTPPDTSATQRLIILPSEIAENTNPAAPADPSPAAMSAAIIPNPGISTQAVLVYPNQGARIDILKGNRIKFQWIAPAGANVTLEIARDSQFKQIFQRYIKLKSHSLVVPISRLGNYYWRIITKEKGRTEVSASAMFNVYWKLPPIQILSPRINQMLETIDAKQGYILKWFAFNAAQYTITLAKNESFVQPLWQRTLQGYIRSIALPSMLPGETYYIKVEGTSWDKTTYTPVIRKIRVKTLVLDKPALLAPTDGDTINITSGQPITFTWQDPDGASDSTWSLFYINKNGSAQPIKHAGLLQDHSYELSDFTGLQAGRYYWQIQAISRSMGGNINSESPAIGQYFNLAVDTLAPPAWQSPNTVSLSNGRVPITWEAIPYAAAYRIYAKSTKGRILRYESDDNQINLKIDPGAYTMKIETINVLGQVASTTEWQKITVVRS